MPCFVHALCALAMFFVYKSHFTHSNEPMLEIQSGLQDCQMHRLASYFVAIWSEMHVFCINHAVFASFEHLHSSYAR